MEGRHGERNSRRACVHFWLTTLQFKKFDILCLLASVPGAAIQLQCMMGPSITRGAITDGPFCNTCSKGTQVSCIVRNYKSCMDSLCIFHLCFLLMPSTLVQMCSVLLPSSVFFFWSWPILLNPLVNNSLLLFQNHWLIHLVSASASNLVRPLFVIPFMNQPDLAFQILQTCALLSSVLLLRNPATGASIQNTQSQDLQLSKLESCQRE